MNTTGHRQRGGGVCPLRAEHARLEICIWARDEPQSPFHWRRKIHGWLEQGIFIFLEFSFTLVNSRCGCMFCIYRYHLQYTTFTLVNSSVCPWPFYSRSETCHVRHIPSSESLAAQLKSLLQNPCPDGRITFGLWKALHRIMQSTSCDRFVYIRQF